MVMNDARLIDELPFRDITTGELIDIFSPTLRLTENLEDSSFHQYVKSISDTELLQNFNFSYVTTEEFAKADYSSGKNIELSLLHLNIRSLNKNNMALYHLLDLINFHFDVIVLSEVWSYNIDLYCNLLAGYSFHYDLPLSGSVGGV